MKTRRLCGILLLFLCIFGIAGCDKEMGEERQITGYEEYVLIVASQKKPSVLWSDGYNYRADVYGVRKEDSDEWMPLGYIEGFEFEEGYEYRLRIGETHYLDRRMGQPAWTVYRLLEVLSMEKKESENLPDHFIPDWYCEECE